MNLNTDMNGAGFPALDELGVRLTPIEARLLNHLVLRGVDSERTMAASLRLKQSTLNYALRRLRELGAIKGFRYRFDLAKLGFGQRVKFALRARSVSAVERILETALSFPECEHAAFLTGNYEVTASFACRGLQDVVSKMLELQQKLGPDVSAINPVISLKCCKVHGVRLDNFSNNGANGAEGITSARVVPVGRLDLRDRQLLSFFASNPEKNILDAAIEFGMHRNTVAARWKQLLDAKVVLKKSVEVAPEFLHVAGTRFKAFMFFDVIPGKIEEVAHRLCDLDEIHELDFISSRHTFIGLIRTREIDAFQRFNYFLRSNEFFKANLIGTRATVILDARSKNTSVSLSALSSHTK